jgi:hypothetical protein
MQALMRIYHFLSYAAKERVIPFCSEAFFFFFLILILIFYLFDGNFILPKYCGQDFRNLVSLIENQSSTSTPFRIITCVLLAVIYALEEFFLSIFFC